MNLVTTNYDVLWLFQKLTNLNIVNYQQLTSRCFWVNRYLLIVGEDHGAQYDSTKSWPTGGACRLPTVTRRPDA